MAEKVKCGRCKHKLPKSICGCQNSPNYGKEMPPNDSCDHFISNPAQEHLSSALAKMVWASSSEPEVMEEAFQHFQEAIRLGLPADDEVIARYSLGKQHLELMRLQPDVKEKDFVSSQHFNDAILEMEKAVALDREGSFGYFSDRINRARLAQLDNAYCYLGALKKESGDLDGAIEYAQDKLSQFDYLPSTPLLDLTCFLGEMFEERGDSANAKLLYAKVVNSEQRDLNGQGKVESQTRELAAERLQALETHSQGKGKCFIATAAYGTPMVPEVQLLMVFRDQVLHKHSLGRWFVKIYYAVSPPLAIVVEKSFILKSLVRWLFISPTVSLIKRAMRKQWQEQENENRA